MNKETIISVLIRVLTQSRDGLILINGEWGVGKTYFLQSEFRRFYPHTSHFYMSVLGLNSLQDFKNRMLSVTYLDDSSEIKDLSNLTSNMTSLFTQEENAGKLAGQIVSIFSGAMKDYVLKDLSGVFIIDDLERIPKRLRNEIATFCLQSYQIDNKLDYILVGNFSKQSNEALSHKEKIISDEIYFSINSLPEILEQRLKDINGGQRDLITQIIMGFEEKNLRIINRILIKLIPLITNQSPPRKLEETNFKNLVSSLCAHIILKEKYCYKENDFHDNYMSSPRKILANTNGINTENENEKISKEESNLLNISVYNSFNKSMVPYCFNMISDKDILPHVYPIKKSLRRKDYASLERPEMYNISENDYLVELEKAILKHTPQTLSVWLTATNNYLRLTKSGYIPLIKSITTAEIEIQKMSFSEGEIKSFFIETNRDIYDIPLHVLRRDGDDLYNYFLDRLKFIIQSEKIESIRSKMIEKGWSAVDMDIYQSRFKFKLLESIGVDLIIEAIKNHWSIYDLQTFSNHLSSLYNFSNLSDYLSDELPHLTKLYDSLEAYNKLLPISFRRGAIIELADCVKNVKESLEKSISKKDSNNK